MSPRPLKWPRWRFNAFLSLIVLLLLALLLRTLDLRTLSSTLASADWSPVILAALINLVVNSFGRIMRFKALIHALPSSNSNKAGLAELSALLLTSRALNLLLPARAGETLRAAQLHRRHGYSLEGALAAILLEPVIDILALGLLAALLWILGLAPSSTANLFYALMVCAGGAIFFSLLIALRRHREGHHLSSPLDMRIRTVFLRFENSIHILNAPRLWLKALGWTWFADLADLLTIGLCLKAVGIELDPASWIVILAGINVAIALPATPGNLGTLEAGAILTLSALGIGKSQALAFALLYHLVQVVPIVAAGLVSLQFTSVVKKRPRPEAAEASTPAALAGRHPGHPRSGSPG